MSSFVRWPVPIAQPGSVGGARVMLLPEVAVDATVTAPVIDGAGDIPAPDAGEATPVIYFSGVDASIEFPVVAALDNLPSGPFTIAVLFRPQGAADDVDRPIIDFATDFPRISALYYGHRGHAPTNVVAQLDVGTDQMGSFSSLSDAIVDYEEYILVVRWDGSSSNPVHSRLLRGGSFTHDQSDITTTMVAGSSIASGLVRIGADFSSQYGEGMIGLDAIWDRYLSDSEVESLVDVDNYTIHSSNWQALSPIHLHHLTSDTDVPDLMGNGGDVTLFNNVVLDQGFVGVIYDAGVSSDDATVTAVPADGTGDVATPTVAADSTVTAPPVDGTGDVAAPAVSADADPIVSPVLDGTGDVPSPAVSADASVTVPPIDGTGDIPPLSDLLSALVDLGSDPENPVVLGGLGSMPAPAVSGTGSGTVVAVPADGTGDLATPSVSADASVTAPPVDGIGDVVAPAVSAGSDVAGPPVDGVGDVPTPGVSADSGITVPPVDGAGDVTAPSVTASADVSAPPLSGVGDMLAPVITPAGRSLPRIDLPTIAIIDPRLDSVVIADPTPTVVLADPTSTVQIAPRLDSYTIDSQETSVTIDGQTSEVLIDA